MPDLALTLLHLCLLLHLPLHLPPLLLLLYQALYCVAQQGQGRAGHAPWLWGAHLQVAAVAAGCVGAAQRVGGRWRHCLIGAVFPPLVAAGVTHLLTDLVSACLAQVLLLLWWQGAALMHSGLDALAERSSSQLLLFLEVLKRLVLLPLQQQPLLAPWLPPPHHALWPAPGRAPHA